jgi:predicted TIM-barrel fold metal-dependent hydrolase
VTNMPTRRCVMLGTMAAGMAMRASSLQAKASQPETSVNFAVPAGACDCHTHIIGDPAAFPFFVGRTYTPETALPEEMTALHRVLHMERVVIVTPSVYGTDNRATLYGIMARGPSARGVAVIDERTTESELEALAQAGVRGIRLNLHTVVPNNPAVTRHRFTAAVERVKHRNWHVQVYPTLDVIMALKDAFAAAPVPIVFDHFADAQAALGPTQPGFADVLDLVKSGKAYVKISGVYRVSKAAPDYADAAPLARALIAANPDRILWGTDWPHTAATPPGKQPTDVTPLSPIDDGRLLNQLAVWAPDTAVREKILVLNPARLYGFG